MSQSIKKITALILSITLGIVFIMSAWYKTLPIEYFETTMTAQLGINVLLAKIAARFFIGLEAGLGLLLVLNFWGKRKWVIKGCFALLVIFSIYLIALWLNLGNEGNCGCLGSLIQMTPAESLIKNAILIALNIVLLKIAPNLPQNKTVNLITFLLIPATIITSFCLFSLDNKVLHLSELYTIENKAINKANIPNIEKGKKMVCMFSLTCTHCRHAATEIAKWKKSNPGLPIVMIFPYSKSSRDTANKMTPAQIDTERNLIIKDFLTTTKADNTPYIFVDRKIFIQMAGSFVPAIYWVNDTIIQRKVEIPELNEKEFERWAK